MARKIRIQRKRKPWLHSQTKQLFAVGNLCLALLRPWARLEADKSRAAYEIARTARTLRDVELKEVTTSYRIEQARRTDLLNAQTRLKMEQEFGKANVARVLGEPVQDEDQFAANYQGV